MKITSKKSILIGAALAASIAALAVGIPLGMTSVPKTNSTTTSSPLIPINNPTIPINHPLIPINDPTSTPLIPINDPTSKPLIPINDPTSTPLIPINPSNPNTPTPVNGQVYSPYADVTMLKSARDTTRYSQLTDFMQNGVKRITTAFFTQNTTYTTPTDQWAGNIDPYGKNSSTSEDASYIKNSIDTFEARGGVIDLSFGGATGVYSWDIPGATSSNLASEMSGLATYFNSNHFDFDVEGGAVLDTAGLTKLGEAIAALRTLDSKYSFSLTLPVLPTGLTSGGLAAYETVSNNAGFPVQIHIMSMDYGSGGGLWDDSKMGQCTISSMENTTKQTVTYLNTTSYKPTTDSATWNNADVYQELLGDTVMIGQNDVQGELFSFQDTQDWLDFTQENKVHKIGFWALTRDYPGSDGLATSTHYSAQTTPGEFTQKIAKIVDPTTTNDIEGTLSISKYALSKKQIAITWANSDVKYAIQYKIYRKDAGSSSYIEVGATANNNYTDSVSEAGNYEYKVVATNLGSSTLSSNELKADNSGSNLFDKIATKYNSALIYQTDDYIAYNDQLYYVKYYYAASSETPDQSDACSLVTSITTLNDLLSFGYSQAAINALK